MDFIVHGILQARILEWVAFPFSNRLVKMTLIYHIKMDDNETFYVLKFTAFFKYAHIYM